MKPGRTFPFYRLMAADLLGNFSIQTIGLVLLSRTVLQGDGGAGALLSISTALQLPSLVAVPLAGPFLDRWSERRLLPCISLARGLTATMLAVWWHIPAVAFFLLGTLTFLGSVSHVARHSLLPLIVQDKGLLRANGLLLRCTIGAGILGPPAAGCLAAAFGAAACIGSAGALYFISALVLLNLPRRNCQRERSTWWNEFVEGFHTLQKSFLLRSFLLTLVLWSFGGGLINFAAPLLFKSRGVTVAVYGIGLSTFAAGQIAATFVAGSAWGERRQGLPSPWIFAVQGLGMIGLLAAEHPASIGLVFLIMGIGSGSAQVCLDSFLQKHARPSLRGRVIGFAVSARGGCFFSAALIGALLSRLGVASLVIGACLLTVSAGVGVRRPSPGPEKNMSDTNTKIRIPVRPRTIDPDWEKRG